MLILELKLVESRLILSIGDYGLRSHHNTLPGDTLIEGVHVGGILRSSLEVGYKTFAGISMSLKVTKSRLVKSRLHHCLSGNILDLLGELCG